MMKRTYLVLLTTLLGLALVSCQQAVVDDASDASSEGKMTVNLNVVQFEQVPFSQAAAPQSSRATNIDSIVTKLCFAVYSSASDTHPKTIVQQKGDSDFGKATFKLDKGTYYLVVLAHKSTIDPDMSNINVIDFKQYVTDTFYAYDTLTIDQSLNKELKLRRAVARFELSTTDNIPDSCTRLQLVLSNVCTAFNPVTGYGTAPAEKNYRSNFKSGETGKPFSFGRCFFPTAEDSKTDVTLSLYTNGQQTFTRTFPDVPIRRNTVTRYIGRLFSEQSLSVSMQSDDEWNVNTVTF